jgi:predicted nucleotidyltransferase
MPSSLPPAVQPLLETYVHALEPLRAQIYGVYLYGSIALGAYEEAVSDIDVIALTQGAWSSRELDQLAKLHQKLMREYEIGRRLDVIYVPVSRLGKSGLEAVAVEFAVSNLCRIFSTIEDGEIVAKSAALKIWRQRLPARWHRLLDEAWRLRHHPAQLALYRFTWTRLRDTVAFIHYARERGGKALDALGIPPDRLY